MLTRRFLLFWLLLALALFCPACAGIRPKHVTVFCERDEAETSTPHRASTSTNKFGVSATYDLP